MTLAMLASVSAGVGAERRWGDAARRAASRLLDVMLFAALPFVAFFSMASLHVTAGVGVGLVVGYAEVGVVTALAWLAGTRVLRLPRPSVGALMCVVVLANTGYLGVPLVAALLGGSQVGAAIAWDVMINAPMLFLVAFAIGATFGTRAGATPRARLRSYLVRNPPVLAVAAGLLAPDALAPAALVDAAHVLALALIAPGFFALGVHLMQEREDGVLAFPPPLTPAVATAVGLRVLVAPALVLLASLVVPGVPDAYMLEAGMPSGVTALLVAHAYGLDLRLTASAVAWSTAIVVAAAGAVSLA
ncbi:MAG TPA: transporter [Solirubrobacteraceae bacterium]|nr:transporter [Solirubrobacteraceae bacterium]